MHKFTTGLALLAFATTLTAISPSIAATTVQFGFNAGTSIDCALPENVNDPYCIQNGRHQRPQQGGNGGWDNDNGPSGDRMGLAQQPRGFGFSSHDRSRFHQDFGFSFGTFAAPGFSVRVGVAVPHSYHDLRQVPRKIYRAYPQFRGYLYFVSNPGDFVIVSPRSHRVVAVI
jgi:hypothetical protein